MRDEIYDSHLGVRTIWTLVMSNVHKKTAHVINFLALNNVTSIKKFVKLLKLNFRFVSVFELIQNK